MRRIIATALTSLLILPLMAEDETFTIFYSNAEQRAHLEKSLAKLPAQDWQWMELTPENTAATSMARSYGIQVSPTLLISALDGRYKTLRGDKINEESLKLALEHLADGESIDERTALLATLAEQRALSSDEMASEEQLEKVVMHCYIALESEYLTDDDRQLIGLRMLYPLLMRQYTRDYDSRGAHNPKTEAKLLEAVKAVELARDINPTSALGREAFTYRDELRKARLKARAYE